MNSRWVLRLARADAAALAPLRLCPGIEVADEEPNTLWVRGSNADEPMQRLLRGLPAGARYEWLPNDRLRPLSSRIPADALPALKWQKLERWLELASPIIALSAEQPRPVPLRLVRSGAEMDPELLLTDLETWTAFALAGAEARLLPLRFAVRDNGQVLIRGTPLPPLPGPRFVVHGSLAVPAGYTWEPAVSLAVVLRRFGLAADGLAVWHEDGTFTRLHVEQFIATTRGAIRATAEAAAGP